MFAFSKARPHFSICRDNRELPSIVGAITIRRVIQAHSPNPSPLTSSSWMLSSHLSVSRATSPLEYKWILCPTAAVVTMSPTSLHPLTFPSLGFRATDMGVNMVLVCGNVRENSRWGELLKVRVCGFLREQWESCSAQFHSVGRYESTICGEPFRDDRSGEQDVTQRWDKDGWWGDGTKDFIDFGKVLRLDTDEWGWNMFAYQTALGNTLFWLFWLVDHGIRLTYFYITKLWCHS